MPRCHFREWSDNQQRLTKLTFAPGAADFRPSASMHQPARQVPCLLKAGQLLMLDFVLLSALSGLQYCAQQSAQDCRAAADRCAGPSRDINMSYTVLSPTMCDREVSEPLWRMRREPHLHPASCSRSHVTNIVLFVSVHFCARHTYSS